MTAAPAALTLRPATSTDVPAVVGLFEEASAWLRSRGSDQWQYPPHVDRITADIAAGTVWVAERDGQVLATVTVDDHADPEFWGPDDHPDDALYVHRCVVSRAAAGQDIGTTLLNWASHQARSTGRRWIRLDAWATNKQLARYYTDRGWTHVRTLRLPHRGSGALFQRESGTTSATSLDLVEIPVAAPSPTTTRLV